MPQAVTAVTAVLAPNDLKFIMWFAGIFLSTACGGAAAAWWFSRNQSQTRKELYTKINYVERNVTDKLEKSQKDCTNTKERVGLLEQSHNHLERRMDDMDGKLTTIQMDITAMKETQIRSEQKASEQAMTIIGEVRSIGDKITINKLLESQKR